MNAKTVTSTQTPVSNSATISPEEKHQLHILRAHRRDHRRLHGKKLPPTAATETVSVVDAENFEVSVVTRGQRLADTVAKTIGSWRFIIIQSSAIAVWITGNVVAGTSAWDPYPFILLNLLLSFQAAYTAPAIMMSQNRQSELDRRHAENDYEVNVKAELEIELLHEKIDIMKERELLALTAAVRDLSTRLEELTRRMPAPQ